MAYNLQSLLHTLELILQPDARLCLRDNERRLLENIVEKTTTLKQILENFSLATYKAAERLVSQVTDAAHKAECILDHAILAQIPTDPGAERSIVSIPDSCGKGTFPVYMQQITDELDSLTNEALKMVDLAPEGSSTGHSFTPNLNPQNIVVGLEQDMILLNFRLTGWEKNLKIIPITGMDGIGKTTLAQNLYCDRRIISHFDCSAWAAISQEYDIRKILLSLLHCIETENGDEKIQNLETSELAQKLYQSLIGLRYLIVLDDIWITTVWDEIRRFFPDNKNGSRIIITTRELDVASYVVPPSLHHQMHFLDEVESWDLFHGKVFGNKQCPHELGDIGREIATSCKCLPLAIQVISGLLSESPKTKSFWEHVGKDVTTAASLRDEHFSKILSLSYDLLPLHLRPCLLYIGAFPEDTRIRVSKIKRLWATEGFLKPIVDKTPEEVAEEYLNALESRNLLLVRSWKRNKKVKSYGIHDLLRDLCRRKADEEKFVVFHLQQANMHLTSKLETFHSLILNDTNLHTFEAGNSTDEFGRANVAHRFSGEQDNALYCSHGRPVTRVFTRYSFWNLA